MTAMLMHVEAHTKAGEEQIGHRGEAKPIQDCSTCCALCNEPRSAKEQRPCV